ncbi:SURF1 family protein [Alishewanella tabrizica]|uniref:SURF1-like protein n=1 Tax=Alishewanella tabrizica TaxID=671278 RepID=A0ABQ2WS23_9ALTE|nr:SURF1 family protein [Alishewanella tabrizica]GGW68818.1 SURF1-like protein [Alishewanella tabrizica]
MQLMLFGHRFIINRLWLLLTLAAFAILIKLSYWQLQRATEKTEQLQQLAQQLQQGPVAGEDLLSQVVTAVDGLVIQDDAYWLPPFIWLLDNQILEGRVGYDVIIPVQFTDSTTAVLVNLGWVAAPPSRQQLPQLDIPEVLALDGLVRTKMGGVLLGQNIEGNTYPMRMQQVDFSLLQQQLPLSLYPALVYQQQPSAFIPHYQAVVLPPEKHRGYALQWFGLALAVLGVAFAASKQSIKE